METAVPVNQSIRIFKKIQEVLPETEKASKDESLIHDLANDPRWEAMVRVIDQTVTNLESLNSAIDERDTPETIGFKFMAVKTATAALRAIRNLPQAIAESDNLNVRAKK